MTKTNIDGRLLEIADASECYEKRITESELINRLVKEGFSANDANLAMLRALGHSRIVIGQLDRVHVVELWR